MVDTSKELLKNRNQNFTVVRYFTWTLEFLSNIFASNLLQAPSNFFLLTVLVAMKYLTQFKHKIRATKLQNNAKIYLAWYLLFQSLHWGSNLVSKYFSIWSGAFYRKIKRIRINTSVQGVSSKPYLHLKDNDKEDKKNKKCTKNV